MTTKKIERISVMHSLFFSVINLSLSDYNEFKELSTVLGA